jgi:hypothetical protein
MQGIPKISIATVMLFINSSFLIGRCWVPNTNKNTCIPGKDEVACRDLKKVTGKMYRSPTTCCNELREMMKPSNTSAQMPKDPGGVCALWTLQGQRPMECFYVDPLVSDVVEPSWPWLRAWHLAYLELSSTHTTLPLLSGATCGSLHSVVKILVTL